MADAYHLSLSLSRQLWEELLSAALPVTIAEGEVDLATAVEQIGVRQRLAGLLEDRARGFQSPLRLRERTRGLRKRVRSGVTRRAQQVVFVELSYKVELDRQDTALGYGRQRVTADAWLKGTAEGTLHLLSDNLVLPFHFERRLGASVVLGDVRYDRSRQAVIGQLQDLVIHAGASTGWQLVARAAETVLERRLGAVNPVPILRRAQVQEMVGGMGGALRVQMAVETLDLVIDETDMTLKVRFGFTHKQLPDRAPEA